MTDVGVSNFSLEKWHASEEALGSPVLSNQVQYSLVARKPDAELIPYAQSNDRLVIAYSPLGMGMLSGRYNSAHQPKSPVRLNNPMFLPETLDRRATVDRFGPARSPTRTTRLPRRSGSRGCSATTT